MMIKGYEYTKGSWQAVTDEIKKSLGINCLTPELAKTILALYIKGASVAEIIKQLEGEK